MKRLSFDQSSLLMKEGKIPSAFNECIRSNQPLADMNGKILCVLPHSTPYCNICPFDKGRLSREDEEAHQVLHVGAPISFGAKIAEMSRDKQYIVTVPVKLVRENGLQNKYVKVTLELV